MYMYIRTYIHVHVLYICTYITGYIRFSMNVYTYVHSSCTVSIYRVQSLQALAVLEPAESNKPLVERELAILSALCNHVYPTLQDGEQHPVKLPHITYKFLQC